MSQSGQVRMRQIVKRHGPTQVLHGIDLDIQAGEFMVLLGPSGSGKSTTLRILAGLEEVTAGEVWFDDQNVTQLEPGDRDVAMVFQSYALYPHMTVAQNIGFPLRMTGQQASQVEAAVQQAAQRVGIDHLLQRRPGQLSGGQQQRVALARAIVRQPRLFLLDEPLSNLDAKLRLETRLELHQLHRELGVTTVYVTHDQEEAMTLADRIAVFMDGRIVQVGTPREIFGRPSCAAVAEFIGAPPMNLLMVTWHNDHIEWAGVSHPIDRHSGPTRAVRMGVRPADVRLTSQGSPATVLSVEVLGEHAIVNLACGDQRLKAKVDASIEVQEGQSVGLSFQPQSPHLFDPASGERIA
jgi:multiple sugar transport system ATP-binding protein